MATLPRAYTMERPTLRPNTSAPQAETGQVERAIGQVGQAVGGIAQEMQREDDAQQLFEARRELDAWERENIYDPEKGAANKQGRDAFGVGKTLDESYEKRVGEIGARFGGANALRFKEMAEARRGQVADWATKHEFQQRKVFNEQQYQADINGFASRASLYADDPAKVQTELNLARERTINHLKSQGASEEVIQDAIRRNTQSIHAGALGAMVDAENIEGAKAYLNRNGAEIDERTRAIAGKAIKTIETTNQAQTFADEAFGKGMSLQDALAGAREKFSGDTEKHAISEIKMRWQEKEAIEADAVKGRVDEAWQQLTTRGRINPSLMAQLPGKEIAQIQQYQRARAAEGRAAAREARAEAKEKAESEGFKRYMELRQSALDNPTGFASMDLQREFGSVGKSQLEQLMDLQGKIKSGKPGEAESVLTTQQRISAAVDEVTSGMDKKKADLAKGRLTSFIQEQINEAERDGKKATPKEVAEIVRRSTFEAVTKPGSKGWLWDTDPTTKRVYDMTPEDKAAALQNIPPATKTQIIDALRKTGRPVTDAAIFDLYTRVKPQ